MVISGTSDKFWNSAEVVAFLNANQHQHITLDVNPEAVCLTTLGVYQLLDSFEFASVTINTWNPLERHDRYTIKIKGTNFWFDQTAVVDPDLHDWDLSHVFLCFYHRPTAARLGLASYAQQYNTLMHFSAVINADSKYNFELDKLFEYDTRSMIRAAGLLPSLPILQAPADKLIQANKHHTAFHGYDYTDTLTQMYRSILVDLVVESHVSGSTFFPTEKTVRAMLMKKPFVIFGSRDYLEYLRQMGFRTFSDFWPEEYDGYQGGDRLRKIYQSMDYIAEQPLDKLQSMWWDMKYSLDHNYDLLMSKKFNRKIKPL